MDILSSLRSGHPEELLALARVVRMLTSQRRQEQQWLQTLGPGMKECYKMFKETDKDATTLLFLIPDSEMRSWACLTMLIFRALDTIEDDMNIPQEEKIKLFLDFWKNLDNPDWKYTECTVEGDRIALEQFPLLSSELSAMGKKWKDLTQGFIKRVGEGMSVCNNHNAQTCAELEEYCVKVTCELVRVGTAAYQLHLSDLNIPNSLGNISVDSVNSLGIYVQYTDNINDFYKDTAGGLSPWPKELWSKYCDNVMDLRKPAYKKQALQCLSQMVIRALDHFPGVLLYYSSFQDIHKHMRATGFFVLEATAILKKVYNNPQVFTSRKVKLRKGRTARLLLISHEFLPTMRELEKILCGLLRNVSPNDPAAEKMREGVKAAISACQKYA